MPNSSGTDRPALLGLLNDVQSIPSLRRPLTGAAFWTAIALPFLYLPLLASGLAVPATRAAVLGLVGLNVVTLLVGHAYRER